MLSRLIDPVDSRALGLARIGLGIAATIRSLIAVPVLLGLVSETTLRAPQLELLPRPPVAMAIAVLLLWAVSGVLFTIGWRVSISGSVLVACIVYNLAVDQQTYSNHLYLMAWLVTLMILAQAGNGLAWREEGRPVIRWPILLLKSQVTIVYLFSAFTKLNDGWLSGRALAGVLRDGLVDFPESLRTPSLLVPLAAIVILVEVFIGIGLWLPRYRPAAFGLGLVFHLSIVLLIDSWAELLVFAVEMLAIYPLFLTEGRRELVWDDDCGSCEDWVQRFESLDVLQRLEPIPKKTSSLDHGEVERAMYLIGPDGTSSGFAAVTRVLENVVPTLWVAPLLRLPVLSHLGDRWYRWQAARRSCAIGARPL